VIDGSIQAKIKPILKNFHSLFLFYYQKLMEPLIHLHLQIIHLTHLIVFFLHFFKLILAFQLIPCFLYLETVIDIFSDLNFLYFLADFVFISYLNRCYFFLMEYFLYYLFILSFIKFLAKFFPSFSYRFLFFQGFMNFLLIKFSYNFLNLPLYHK
jgi:hypothetical protein